MPHLDPSTTPHLDPSTIRLDHATSSTTRQPRPTLSCQPRPTSSHRPSTSNTPRQARPVKHDPSTSPHLALSTSPYHATSSTTTRTTRGPRRPPATITTTRGRGPPCNEGKATRGSGDEGTRGPMATPPHRPFRPLRHVNDHHASHDPTPGTRHGQCPGELPCTLQAQHDADSPPRILHPGRAVVAPLPVSHCHIMVGPHPCQFTAQDGWW